MKIFSTKKAFLMGIFSFALAVSGCDQQRIELTEESVSTETEVRSKWGEPEKIWDAEGGVRIFEYNRQPQGHRNYQITIGSDGKVLALRQVLTEQNFAKVKPGMMMEDLRKLLGKPAKIMNYPLKPEETIYTWRFLGNGGTSDMVFNVTLDKNFQVSGSEIAIDRESARNGYIGG